MAFWLQKTSGPDLDHLFQAVGLHFFLLGVLLLLEEVGSCLMLSGVIVIFIAALHIISVKCVIHTWIATKIKLLALLDLPNVRFTTLLSRHDFKVHNAILLPRRYHKGGLTFLHGWLAGSLDGALLFQINLFNRQSLFFTLDVKLFQLLLLDIVALIDCFLPPLQARVQLLRYFNYFLAGQWSQRRVLALDLHVLGGCAVNRWFVQCILCYLFAQGHVGLKLLV